MLPNTNISTTVVGNELGVSTRNVRSLCTSGAINKWSKYKPVGSANSVNINSNWYKAPDGWCGFKDMNNGSDAMALYRNNTAYKYLTPVQSSGHAFRLGDFRQYNHNALPFVRSNVAKDSVSTWDTTYGSFTLTLSSVNNTTTNSNLTSADFGEFAACKFAIDIYSIDPMLNSNASPVKQFVSANYIGSTPNQVDQIVLNSESGINLTTFWCVFVLSKNSGSNKFPIPYTDSNYFMTKVNVITSVTISIAVEGVASYPKSNLYKHPTEYNEISKLPVNGGRFQIKCLVTNRLTERLVMNNTNYNFRARLQPYNISGTSSYISANFSHTSEVIVPPKGTAYLYLDFYDILSVNRTGRCVILLTYGGTNSEDHNVSGFSVVI